MTRRTTARSDLRAALYERVSSEEQVQGYSLDAQDRAGRLYCETHGWTVVGVYRDEGKSARTDDLTKRPHFARLLADAEAGLLDVVVVHKLDRFARNLRVTLDTLERLERAGVAFVSIGEQMDFTTPIGKVILATLAGFAQYYSDNLSFETKKGKTERKRQGLYNGLLPFGLKKNRDGIPVPDPETYPGLLLAFRLAAEGRSDRAVAEALNAAGHRTTGNRGRNPFTRDTVRPLLQNRFYLGELPNGASGWMPGAHDPVLDVDLFDQAQVARAANQSGAVKVNRLHRQHSLSGLAICGHCGGRLHIATDRRGVTRIYCYQRRQASRCGQRSAPLAAVEAQIAAYLSGFHLPEETVARVVALYERATEERDDVERRRRELTNRLERTTDLYRWGDLTREAFQAERDRLQAELGTLRGTDQRADLVAQAATFLRDLPAAWAAASPEQRNRLARLVFRAVEVRDDRLVAVTAKPDFAPFFLLNADGADGADAHERRRPSSDGSGGSDGDCSRGCILPPGAVMIATAPPRLAPGASGRASYREPRARRLSPADEAAIRATASSRSLRDLASEYGVSHETIRATLRRAATATAL